MFEKPHDSGGVNRSCSCGSTAWPLHAGSCCNSENSQTSWTKMCILASLLEELLFHIASSCPSMRDCLWSEAHMAQGSVCNWLPHNSLLISITVKAGKISSSFPIPLCSVTNPASKLDIELDSCTPLFTVRPKKSQRGWRKLIQGFIFAFHWPVKDQYGRVARYSFQHWAAEKRLSAQNNSQL